MLAPQNKYSLFQKSFLSILLIFVVSITNAQNIKFSFLFDSGKDRVALWEAKDFFKLIKGIKADSISIQGHCDSVGSDAYNLKLSKQRVQAVKSMLLHNGIKAKQIKIMKGFGEQQNINDNSTEDNRLRNRRVEVYVNEVPKIEKPIIPKVEKPKPEKKAIAKQKPEPKPVEKAVPKKVEQPIDIKYATFQQGEKIFLPNLTFEGQRHHLTALGEEAFLQLLAKIKENPEIQFLIVGHICCVNPYAGDAMDIDVGTQNLSEMRAKEIYDRLADAGIEKSRMKYFGKAATEKIYPYELTSFEASMNRRVEIIIVK